MAEFTYPNNQPIVQLDSQTAFSLLTEKERLYAHYLTQASWYGGLIVLYQTSPESPLIFAILQKLFKTHSIEELKSLALSKCDFTEEDFTAILVYACGIYTNMGNYKGFGDAKFIPNLPKEKFSKLMALDEEINNLYLKVSENMYSIFPKHLGFSVEGMTTYFSKGCTKKDSELVNLFFKEMNLESYNTRLFKLGPNKYEVRLASVYGSGSNKDCQLLGPHQLETIPGSEFTITSGDYSPLLEDVNKFLEKTMEYADNDTQSQMIKHYIRSFKTGSIDAHKDGSRFWIKDKGPVVETYIGFIETYRDPAGMRAEFEGFVAMVNKAKSAKFSALVEKSEELIPLLPWPTSFEKDQFLRPDFTSLDVLCFAGSGIPAGICIPNYDEVRQNEGFKNVSLGNVIPASYKDSSPNYLGEEDQELLKNHRIGSFEVQVGLHELLGHGTGKLFMKNQDETFNFDLDIINPETNEKVSSWYNVGDTYDSVFTSLGSSYEECRAECVGLYLSTVDSVLKIFGYEQEEAANVQYVNWLSLIQGGLESLQMYDDATTSWLQAHSQARFVILQVLLEAGQDFVTLKQITGADSKPDLILTLDRSKILSVGKPAIGDFLSKLQVFKSTADIKRATELYTKYSTVTPLFREYQVIVQARKKPRKMFVQANTKLQDGKVIVQTYDATFEGLVQSWIERFDSSIHPKLVELWTKDLPHFS